MQSMFCTGTNVSKMGIFMINGKKLVALCTSRVYEPQIHGFIVELNERLRAENYSLLIFAINSDIYWEEDRQAAEKYVFNLIPYDAVDSIIILDEKIKSHKIANKIIKHANEHNVPVIISDGTYDNTSTVNYSYEAGFEKVVRHVIEYHKVKRPHMMAGQPNNDFSNRRIDVFKRVLEENNIPFDESMLSYGYFWSEPCRVAMKKLLERDEIPEAIICANDVMAITVIEMLTDAGYKVPEDIIVTGFDGYDEIYFTSPKVTTASCDIILLADESVNTMLQTIKDGKYHNNFITPVFIPNESCGCPEHSEHPQILKDWFKESFSRHNDDNRVLQRLTSSMQMSQTPGEMVSHLECYKTDNLLAVVDRKCFDNEINYFTDENNNQKKEFVLIYDADNPKDYKPGTFHIPESISYSEDILSPSIRDRILELTESGFPLIFNSLDFMNRPFGFVCYYFRDYYISNYSNTMAATNAISTGIGGYINLQYQTSLLNQMDEMYRHDPLTGLYNRIGFQNDFKKIRKSGKFRDSKVTVIMSDLDGLKYINDTFGHAAGDSAIFAVGKALQNATPDPSLSTRFGGDEMFSLIFGECDPDQIIRDIDEYLVKYNEEHDLPYEVATSTGYITSVMDEDFDLTQAVKDADTKMYETKSEKYRLKGFRYTAE